MASRARRADTARPPVAVLDIGSNSGRVVVYQPEPAGHLLLVAGARAPLRLVRELEATGRLGEAAISRTLEALADFRALALGAGAENIVALATSAVREAEDGPMLVDSIRKRLGIEVEVLDGEAEARYGFVGAIRGLPVQHGLLFDMGGGSLQLARFRHRRVERTLSLPLGALRLSERFLASDPPKKAERHALRAHVLARLAEARVRPLGPDESLVGTGGSCRNLAKIDRRPRVYPVTRLHGYRLARTRIAELASRLAAKRESRRGKVAGLSRDRADSIAGGSLGILALLEHLEADEVLVAGQGVREGAAYSLLDRDVPRPAESRAVSVEALCRRFVTWDVRRADRRERLVGELLRRVKPAPSSAVGSLLGPAARLLDVGVSVDYFDRHAHAADIVLATDLEGFTHREIALLSSLVRGVSENPEPKRYGPLVTTAERPDLVRGAVLLALADDIEERCARQKVIRLRVRRREEVVRLRVTGLLGWRPRGLEERFARAFGCRLSVEPA